MNIYFRLGSEMLIVRVEGENLFFGTPETAGINFAPIEGLKLSRSGIVKEFPDLKDKELREMRKEAIKRFKKHVLELKTMEKRKEYVIAELTKQGYSAQGVQRDGHRYKRL